MTRPRLLVIDDDPEVEALLCRVARSTGFEALALQDSWRISEELDAFAPDAVVLDLVMPEVDGIETLRLIAGHQRRPRLVLMSGFESSYLESAERLAAAYGLQPAAILQKPVDMDHLRSVLNGLKGA